MPLAGIDSDMQFYFEILIFKTFMGTVATYFIRFNLDVFIVTLCYKFNFPLSLGSLSFHCQ